MIRIGELEIGEMSRRPRTAVVGKDLQRRAFERSPHYEVAHARGYDAESHVQAMDIEGIDVAILYGTRGRQVQMHDDLDPLVADALGRAHNNWTADYCRYDPKRLKFAAQVAFHDPKLAAREARRAVRERGAVAVIGNPNPINGRHVHDPELEPLWDAIEELGVPIGFHPTGQASLRDDIARRYLDTPNGRVIGVAGRNPVELMFAFASMAAGGVLERHPGLRCAFLEGTCGWLPWWLWRLDEAWEKFGPGSEGQITGLPSEYFYRQCYVATDADEKGLRQGVEAGGGGGTADARRARGEDAPLLGLPMTLKESINVRGLRTTIGMEMWKDFRSEHDAPVTTRVKAAGAVVMAKTNVPQMLADWQSANPVHGRTNNPWDLARTPGGSTGGGAAALAAGLTPLEFGSDIGGSIRVPAVLCGVCGHRPSETAMPRSGQFPYPPMPNAAVVIGLQGPPGRSARDLEPARGGAPGPP